MQSATFKLNSKFVQAGAGAGKTTSLSKHVFESLQSMYVVKKVYPRFVVCTFTIKATQELRERLIANAYASENSRLLDVIKDPSHVTITTIHGLLNGILRKYALDFHLQPDFELQEELQENRFRRKLTRKLLLQNSKFQKLLEIFSFKEINDILYTLFLTRLSQSTLQPVSDKDLQEGLAKEVATLMKRIEKVESMISGKEAFTDFNIFLSKVKVDISQMVEIDSVTFPRKSKKLGIEDEDWDEIQSLQKFFKENGDKAYWNIGFWQQHLFHFDLLQELFSLYFQSLLERKVKASKICLSEIEGVANYLFTQYPDVCIKISEQIDYWYIDEFQDTSPLQVLLLSKLIHNRPYYVVGDPQQSIYLFRGADVSLFSKVRDEFQQKKQDIHILDVNYRSCSSLLYVINDIFVPLQFLPMKPAKNSASTNAADIVLHEGETSFEQIAGIIFDLHRSGKKLSQIAILTKTNDELLEIQKFLLDKKIPVLVSASGGLFDNRWVKDLLYFLLFLANPHNNEVLYALLRNPLFAIEEAEIKELFTTSNTTNNKASIWSTVPNWVSTYPKLQVLIDFINKVQQDSFSQVLQEFIVRYDVLTKAMASDGSGLTYANILKFQQLLKEEEKKIGFNIITYTKYCLGYYSRYEESEAMSPLVDDHVQLMTVHKSKGLQFDYVILPFMHKSFRAYQYRNLIVNSEQTQWTLSMPYGEENKRQHNIFGVTHEKEEENKKSQENVRLFYVAVTRAIEKVYFVGKNKFSTGSWFSLLPAKFFTEEILQTSQYVVQQKQYETEGIYTTSSIIYKTTKAKDLLLPTKRFSVTEILSNETAHMPVVNVKQLLLSEHLGTKTHAILERWRFHQQEEADTEIITYLKQQKEFPFEKLMQVAQVEWGFTYKIDDFLMEGKVDLWGVVDEQLWVVDYKTGSDRYKEKAFSQLQYYSLPIRKYTKQPTAKLVVVYPFSKTCYVSEAEAETVVLLNMRQDLQNWQAKTESLIRTL